MGLLSLSLFLAEIAPAQLTRGFLSGTVQDSSGGVIGGAHVTAVRSSTGFSRETVTNSLGIFRFAAVEPEFTAWNSRAPASTRSSWNKWK